MRQDVLSEIRERPSRRTGPAERGPRGHLHPVLLEGPDHRCPARCYVNQTWRMTPVSKAPAEEGQVPKAREPIRCRSTAGLGEAGARGTVGLQRAGPGRALTGLVPSGRGRVGGCGRATPAARTELGALGWGRSRPAWGLRAARLRRAGVCGAGPHPRGSHTRNF